MALNGGADSPTVFYLFMAAVLFGYYLPTRWAIAFLALAVLIPATPLLYDPDALEPTYIAKLVLTAPIFAGVGLAVVLAKRQLVGWRNQALGQALLDPLTGLPNRRALTDALREQIANRRHGPAPGLLMMDLDDFKAINTTYGHVGGDTALRSVAAILRRTTRESDLVARLGGDEFAVLAPAATEDDLARLAQRIVDAIRATELKLSPRGQRLTASVGFTILDPANRNVDAFLAAADRQLRIAKGGGKDRWGAALTAV
jgi:diguanylate cyclase (GGDEF)-like protein